jgi:Recombination endonuclease VII
MSKNGKGLWIVLTLEQEREVAELQEPLFGFTYDEARYLVVLPELKRQIRDRQRQINARRGGYKPPPPEAECPPRPSDKRCQLCGRVTKDRPRGPSRTMTPGLDLDHCHFTGIFRGWLCYGCNRAIGRVEKYIGVSRLESYLLGGAVHLASALHLSTPEDERAVREDYIARVAEMRALIRQSAQR